MEIKVIFILFSFVLIRSCNFGWCVLNKIRICVKLPICCFSSISFFRGRGRVASLKIVASGNVIRFGVKYLFKRSFVGLTLIGRKEGGQETG